ncbi:hypothetical protein [Methylocapsa sp. S129]|nr:hypothetical protein [Methylocapsa sp. S129]
MSASTQNSHFGAPVQKMRGNTFLDNQIASEPLGKKIQATLLHLDAP